MSLKQITMQKSVFFMQSKDFDFKKIKSEEYKILENSYFLEKILLTQKKVLAIYFIDYEKAHFFILDEIKSLKLKYPNLRVLAFTNNFDNKDLTKLLSYQVDYPIPVELGLDFLLNFIESLKLNFEKNDDAVHYKFANLEIDLNQRIVKRGPHYITLRKKEFDLLSFLIKRKGSVVSRTELLEKVWKYHNYAQTNTVDVHFSKLRRKVDKGFANKLLHTVWGMGYKLDLVP